MLVNEVFVNTAIYTLYLDNFTGTSFNEDFQDFVSIVYAKTLLDPEFSSHYFISCAIDNGAVKDIMITIILK